MGVVTDLAEIRRLGTSRSRENQDFRRYLAAHHQPIEPFQILAGETARQIDCTACANCCRVATTKVNERDIERLVKFIGMKRADFLKEYTAMTDDEGRVLRRNEHGCVFLSGNACTVYEARPGTCRDFPHLAHGAGSFLSRMWEMPDRATFCPIVYNSLEAFKDETGFRR